MAQTKQQTSLTKLPDRWELTIIFLFQFAIGITLALGFASLVSYSSQGDPNNVQKVLILNGFATFYIFPTYLNLTLAGTLGGLLYSMLIDRTLEFPSFGKKDKGLQPGFLGDIFVGIVGAFIAYFFLPEPLKNPNYINFPEVFNNSKELLNINLDLPKLLENPELLNNSELLKNINLFELLNKIDLPKKLESPKSEISIMIFVTGLVGGYGGKYVLDAALQRLIKRIDNVDLTKAKESLEKRSKVEYLQKLANRQIFQGLNLEELSKLQNQLQNVSLDSKVKKRIIDAARDARRLGSRVKIYEDRINRVTPILEALVKGEPDNDYYHAQLACAYRDYLPPRLNEAISQFNEAIELRKSKPGKSNNWHYELDRVVTLIRKAFQDGESNEESSLSSENILADLLTIDRNQSLARIFLEFDLGRTKPIKDWLGKNQDWVRQRSGGSDLLRQAFKSIGGIPIISIDDWILAPPNTTIKATTQTYLKKQPIQASELLEDQKVLVIVGKEYTVLKYSEKTDGHYLVELDYGAGIWYIWSAHWQLPWEDKILSSVQGSAITKTTATLSSSHQSNDIVTRQQAESVYGRALTDKQFKDLNDCLHQFEINTLPRIRHFLSQTAHESGGLKFMKELWGPTRDQRTYDPPHRKARELGNTKKGDGKKYRGAGVIQLTGKNNYQAFAKFTNDPKVMDGADYVGATYPFTSAGVWWKNNNMNILCDRGGTVRQVTKRVNGGYNGLQDRQRYYDKACQVIRQVPSPSSVGTVQSASVIQMTPSTIHSLSLQGSVGRGGTNNAEDVIKVKERLQELGFDFFKPGANPDQGLIQAIKLFQSIITGKTSLGGDGVIDVNKNTHKFLQAANAPRWMLMPTKGEGFFNREVVIETSDHHDYGTSWLADTIQSAGEHYEKTYRKGNSGISLIPINDVSFKQGGDTPDHAGHECGNACDVALPRKDGNFRAVVSHWSSDRNYDRNAARAMIKSLRAQPLVTRVLFNDTVLINEKLCKHARGHDNHIHFEVGVLPRA